MAQSRADSVSRHHLMPAAYPVTHKKKMPCKGQLSTADAKAAQEEAEKLNAQVATCCTKL